MERISFEFHLKNRHEKTGNVVVSGFSPDIFFGAACWLSRSYRYRKSSYRLYTWRIYSEIFRFCSMWKNLLVANCEIESCGLCDMKFAFEHPRSGYFTHRRCISPQISLDAKRQISLKKSTCFVQMLFSWHWRLILIRPKKRCIFQKDKISS